MYCNVILFIFQKNYFVVFYLKIVINAAIIATVKMNGIMCFSKIGSSSISNGFMVV